MVSIGTDSPGGRHLLQDSVERLRRARHRGDFASIFERVADHFSFDYYVYVRFSRRALDSETPFALTSYPAAWAQEYLESGYQSIDPVVKRALTDPAPFLWRTDDSEFQQTDRQRRLMVSADAHGLGQGYCIPIYDMDNRLSLVAFAASRQNSEFLKPLHNDTTVFHLTCMYIHTHISSSFNQSDRKDYSLSAREIECLKWAAAGKTSWEIGKILGISERTVYFHWSNAKHKLGASSLKLAISLAIQQGLVTVD